MFINFSNHPSAQWSAAQRAAAERYGDIMDIPFPDISPSADEAELDRMAEEYCRRILHLAPEMVLCQGESTFVYRVVRQLEEQGVPVVAACSRRKSQETHYPDGSTLKRSIFEFAGFRRYGTPL